MSKVFAILRKENGEIANKQIIRQLFDSLKDGRYQVEVISADHRSGQQNRYYWGLVIPIIQKGIKDLGTDLSKEETHEFLKARFNYSELVNVGTGEIIQVPTSTTKLNKEGFSEYIGKIQQFAAEWLHIVVPDPGVQTEMSYGN